MLDSERRRKSQFRMFVCAAMDTLLIQRQKFSVHWADQGTNVDSATYIKLDGFTVPGRFLFGKGQAQRSGVRVGDDLERPFQFSRVDEGEIRAYHAELSCQSHGLIPIRIVASLAQAGHTNNLEVGTIVVKIKLVRRNGRHQPNAPQTIPSPVRGTRQSDETCIRCGPDPTIARED